MEYETCNDGGGLQRLAQAHVVSQAAVQARAAQEGQPGNALLLVRPQLTLQLHRQLKVLNLQAQATTYNAGSSTHYLSIEGRTGTERAAH